jgi:hypothetical protein
MDGNTSFKRLKDAGHTDERVFHSDYNVPFSTVQTFKDDVKLKPGLYTTKPQRKKDTNSLDTPKTYEAPPFGNDTTKCTENWTAANAVVEEINTVFEQTGGYVSACRHGLVLTFVEMRRSGELAKYGLATIDRLLQVFGDDQAIGCDIACSFMTTVRNSSLRNRAHNHRLTMALNAFHGHAHGRSCQLHWLPLHLPGFGLEDMETCERVFSASNAVARLVRHSSYFHYMQFIDLHLQQWDEDKYCELSECFAFIIVAY